MLLQNGEVATILLKNRAAYVIETKLKIFEEVRKWTCLV